MKRERKNSLHVEVSQSSYGGSKTHFVQSSWRFPVLGLEIVTWGSLILPRPPRRVLQELDTSRDGKATIMAAGNMGHVVFQELFQGVKSPKKWRNIIDFPCVHLRCSFLKWALMAGTRCKLQPWDLRFESLFFMISTSTLKIRHMKFSVRPTLW